MTKIIKRNIFNTIKTHLKQKEITVLTGPRQAGKTTLLMSLRDSLIIENKISEKNIFYFNLDRFTDLDFFSSQEEVIKFIESRKNLGTLYLFVDEAQRIKEAGLFFKGIYDLNLPLKLILTGSSTLEIKSKFIEPLTGRKRLFHLYPFNFDEFLTAKKPELQEISQKKSLSDYDTKKILNLLWEFLVFGGYPQVVTTDNFAQKGKILEEIYNSYIEKDIIAFLQIKKPSVFKKITSLLSFQNGQLLNTNELASSSSVERKTIEHYLNILEETFIIKLVAPFFSNARKELVKMPKVYFIDNGMRNFAINNLELFSGRQDQGQLLENFVADELLKTLKNTGIGLAELHFWRTQHGAEVDFIVRKGHMKLLPIEVKLRVKKSNVPLGLKNFLEDYPSKNALVVNTNLQKKRKHNNTNIHFVYPYKFLKFLKD